MDHDELLHAHLSELHSSNAAYQLLEGLTDRGYLHEAGLLVDLIVAEELSVPAALEIPAEAVPVYRASVEAARPDRKCMNYVLKAFPGWVRSVVPQAREAFAAQMPLLAPAAYDLGDSGMRQVLEAAASDARVLAPVAAYAMTTAEAIRAMASMAELAARHRCVELLESLARVFPASKMEESRDAEHFLPAVGKMVSATEAFPEAMRLAVLLAERNVSSARATAAELTGVIRKVPLAGQAPYLEDFRLVVDSIGIRGIGFCLRTLPGLYERLGMERARQFVSLGCQAAEMYGTAAGQAFLEGKTAAARSAME